MVEVSSTSSKVFTGGSVSVAYGFESAFKTLDSSGINKSFGLNTKVTSLTLNTSQVSLNKLGQVEPTKFVFGQQSGSLGISFVYDDIQAHKVFRCLYELPSASVQSGSTFNYPASLGENTTAAGTPASLNARVQIQRGAGIITRNLKGCIVNSIGISTSIGEVVNGTMDMMFAEESTADIEAASGTISAQTSIDSAAMKPYTFAHGKVKMTTGSGSGMVEVFDIQDIDITFTPNTELLYGLGSHYAQNAFRKVFDIGGRFKTTFKDGALLQYVIDQSIKTLETETVPEGTGATGQSGVGLELTFTNGSKKLEIQLGGVSLVDHSSSGLEPNEVLFEEVNFKAKSSFIKVTV